MGERRLEGKEGGVDSEGVRYGSSALAPFVPVCYSGHLTHRVSSFFEKWRYTSFWHKKNSYWRTNHLFPWWRLQCASRLTLSVVLHRDTLEWIFMPRSRCVRRPIHRSSHSHKTMRANRHAWGLRPLCHLVSALVTRVVITLHASCVVSH
jgi:hypothetical protein